MMVLAAQATQPRSNFNVDQVMLARSVGAVPFQVTDPGSALETAAAAHDLARNERRTVVLNLPIDVQGESFEGELVSPPRAEPGTPPAPTEEDRNLLLGALAASARPVFVAGRGARGPGAGRAIAELADATGALLATSAVAKGLFNGSDWYLDVSGGFSSPLAAELIGDADLIVGWGCALNMWTMRHGKLIGDATRVVQVDDDPAAIGAHRPVAEGVVGDVRVTAEAALAAIDGASARYRTDDVRKRIASEVSWRSVPYDDRGTAETIDPRTLSIALDDILPDDRIVSIDSGNFMGWPSMYLSVPDEFGFCFTQAFQSIGLGLATSIGAALAQPDRLPVAALGDGGALMAIAEMETISRLGLPMVVVVYNDDAYGAEVHHFGPDDEPLDIVEFPPTDIASIARGFGFESMTVRDVGDLEPLQAWVDGERDRPVLIDAKVTSMASWWLEEAFGH
jgi:thiamine pyrophosphate-dependent acetolactate synthase large subunit-like protein